MNMRTIVKENEDFILECYKFVEDEWDHSQYNIVNVNYKITDYLQEFGINEFRNAVDYFEHLSRGFYGDRERYIMYVYPDKELTKELKEKYMECFI